MSFSPDGTLFATTGMNDRLVKIWFENKQRMYLFLSKLIWDFLNFQLIRVYFSSLLLVFPARSIDHTSFSQTVGNDNYSFVYVAHPRAVTHLSWRKTSKYMPK